MNSYYCCYNSCSYYSISLHESVNDITQTCQIDVHVCYWSSSKNQICVCYLDSKFIGHAAANDLLENFSDIINSVDGGKRMIQISMDGLSINWKFFNLLQKDRVKKEQHNLIDIGSCSLHIIPSAFKTGAESSGWNMKAILKGMFTILHDTPVRGEDYISITGVERFSLFFGGNTMGGGYSCYRSFDRDLGQQNQNC